MTHFNNVYVSEKKREAYVLGYNETLGGVEYIRPEFSKQERRAYKKGVADAKRDSL